MHSRALKISGVFGLSGVVLGAFAAHGLKDTLSPDRIATFQTGVHYQLIHSVALLAIARKDFRGLDFTTLAFSLGIILFSGSLYALALTDLKFLGVITPLGGLSFLWGWWNVIRAGSSRHPENLK